MYIQIFNNHPNPDYFVYNIIRDLFKLRKNIYINYEKLVDNQTNMIIDIIKHAYNNTYYYKKIFNASNIKPNDINRLEDINKIPFLTKEDIQGISYSNILSKKYNVNELDVRKTSGSTGKPLVVYVNKKGVRIDTAVWLRALFYNGLKLWDKVAILSNPNYYERMINKKKIYETFGIMRRKYINVLNDSAQQLFLLEKYKPDIIRSYPSYLSILLNKENMTYDIKPKSIFTTSELLDKDTRKLITSSFNTELFDYYSSEEFNLIAWECREHLGYHINIDNVFVEIVSENGEPATRGELGEIVCTSLSNYAMPMIRYKIGDFGRIIDNECPCGITFPLLQVVEGRKDDFLVKSNGSIVSPRTLSDIFQYSPRISLGISQFKMIQEKMNRLKIMLVVKENVEKLDPILVEVENEIKKVMGDNINVEYVFVDKIERDSSGKLRKIISEVHRFH